MPLRPAGTCMSPGGCDFQEGETILFEGSEELFGRVLKCWLVLASCKPVPSTASLCRLLQTSHNRFNPFLSKWGDFMMDSPAYTSATHTKALSREYSVTFEFHHCCTTHIFQKADRTDMDFNQVCTGQTSVLTHI